MSQRVITLNGSIKIVLTFRYCLILATPGGSTEKDNLVYSNEHKH